MKPERLASLPADGMAFDLETHLIQPGIAAPPIVCGSYAWNGKFEPQHKDSEIITTLQPAAFVDFGRMATATYCNHDPIIIGANVAFDLICVMASTPWVQLMFQLYDPTQGALTGDVDGRVYDIQIAEKLHALAVGHLGINPRNGQATHYSLKDCTSMVLGRDDAKVNDRWRMSYALLENIPIDQWPDDARQYPIDDAVNTLEVALAQLQRNRNLHDLSRQVYADFCLKLGGAWGFYVNQQKVDALEKRVTDEYEKTEEEFKRLGFIRSDGTEDSSLIKRAVVHAFAGGQSLRQCPTCLGSCRIRSETSKTKGATKACKDCDGTGTEIPSACPRTEKGAIGKGRDVLQESGDDALMAYASSKEAAKITSTYVPFFRTARDRHGNAIPLTLSPNSLLETGRVSYRGAIQLLPRTGGIRECIEARPGYLFSSEDYVAGELVTHAQNCIDILGYSVLGDTLNAGMDAHRALACQILGIKYDQYESKGKQGKDARQAAKAANFGFPGGMGITKLVLAQRKQGPDTYSPTGPLTDGNGARYYKGLRFCILMSGAEACGTKKVTEYKRKPIPPTCEACLDCACQLRDAWFAQYPENAFYFKHISNVCDNDGEYKQFVSNRVRGGLEFCSAANGLFQGRLADAAKNALCAATREAYDKSVRVTFGQWAGGPSPLQGSHFPLFAHDELVGEHPKSIAAEAATRTAEIMEAALCFMCPSMKKAVKVEPTLMRRLDKGAKTLYDANGRLIPGD